MKREIKGKNVLFITTKNLDYLRNTQEIDIIKAEAKAYKVIGSYSKSYIKRLIKVYWSILSTSLKKYDVIFIGFSPQLIVPFWKWKMRKNKVIIDFFISMYDTFAFDRKKVKPKSFIGKSLKRIDVKTIKSADLVISDTKAHGQYFIDEFGLESNRLEVLYLKADTSIYHPMSVSKPEQYKNKFIVLYFGSILPLQGIDVVLDTIKILQDNKGIHFYMIGPINEKYKKIESDTVTYIEWLPQDELAKYIAFSDLCLAGHFNKESGKANRTIPGKAYIYEAMNKPMILGDNSATRELYNENMEGIYFCEMGNSEKLSNKIIEIKGD